MTLNQFMRKIGYISEKDLVTVALEVCNMNSTAIATDEKNFYFGCGNANAVNYIFARLGIHITSLTKQRNRRKSDDLRRSKDANTSYPWKDIGSAF